MTRDQFRIFNESASQIYATADWLWNHHGQLGLSIEAKRSVMLIRSEAVKMVERIKDVAVEFEHDNS